MKIQKRGFPIGKIVIAAIACFFVAIGFIAHNAGEEGTRERTKEVEKAHDLISSVFGGERPVQRFKTAAETRTESSSQQEGSFFLIVGSMSSSSSLRTFTQQLVRFGWEDGSQRGVYVISEVDLLKVRVALDPTVERPTVSFDFISEVFTDTTGSWDPIRSEAVARFRGKGGHNGILNAYLRSVTIRVKPEDWPQQITLPLGEEPDAGMK